MWLTFLLAVVWTLPSNLDAWQTLVGAVTSATVMTYMIGPISMASLRKTLPNMHRPFTLRGANVINPLAFIAATLIIYWSGWTTNSLLVALVLGSPILYFAFMDRDGASRRKLSTAWKSGAWLIAYNLFILVMTRIGSFGPMKQPLIEGPYLNSLVVVIGSLILYYWGVRSALPEPSFESDTDEDAAPQVVKMRARA